MPDDIAATDSYHPVTEKLIFTRSTDDLPLEGAVFLPDTHTEHNLAVVWIHGGASKFYEHHYVNIMRHLAARGYPCISGNTRGHDAFTPLWRGDEIIPGGSSFERFDESPLDLSAWVDVAMTFGVRGVLLAGHSQGASKVAYYQAIRQDSRVQAVVVASPVVRWPLSPDRVALAARMVSEGRGEDLLPHFEGSPSWNIVSAQMILTRDQIIRHVFDSDTQEPHIARLLCPLLVLYGTNEEVDPNWIEILRRNARAAIDVEMVEGASHEYTGHENIVASLITTWIERLATSTL